MKTNIPERIAALREAMRQQKVDAYIIPSSDPHLSEYPADRWKSREWISGFTGSAGTIVVTADKAGLWTDSRYFLQAASQLEVPVSNSISWRFRRHRLSRNSSCMSYTPDRPLG